RTQARTSRRACMAALAPSGDDSARGGLHEEIGRARHFHRAVFRTAARGRAPDRRDFRNAVLALSIREFYLGLRVGRHIAHHRRRDLNRAAVVVTLTEKNRRDFRPGGSLFDITEAT